MLPGLVDLGLVEMEEVLVGEEELAACHLALVSMLGIEVPHECIASVSWNTSPHSSQLRLSSALGVTIVLPAFTLHEVPLHAKLETLVEATELAPVPRFICNQTLSVRATNISQVLYHCTFKNRLHAMQVLTDAALAQSSRSRKMFSLDSRADDWCFWFLNQNQS